MVVNPSDHFCHGLQIIFYKQLKRYLADIKANGLKFARQTGEAIFRLDRLVVPPYLPIVIVVCREQTDVFIFRRTRIRIFCDCGDF